MERGDEVVGIEGVVELTVVGAVGKVAEPGEVELAVAIEVGGHEVVSIEGNVSG